MELEAHKRREKVSRHSAGSSREASIAGSNTASRRGTKSSHSPISRVNSQDDSFEYDEMDAEIEEFVGASLEEGAPIRPSYRHLTHSLSPASRNTYDRGTEEDISTAAIDLPPDQPGALRIDRDGLMTVQELEELSVGDHIDCRGSESGLISTDGLLEMHISPDDPIVLSSNSNPNDVLARCIGRMLFSDHVRSIAVRPSSAGIGGIYRHTIISPVLQSRPVSAKTLTSAPGGLLSQKAKDKNKIGNIDDELRPYETKRRNVVHRRMPTDRWIPR